MGFARSVPIMQLLIAPVLFYAGAKLSLALALAPQALVMLWMPNGVLLAVLLHYGWRRYGYFAAAIIVAEIAADWPTYSLFEAILFGCINLAEATVAFLMLRRWHFDPAFTTPADLAKFLLAGPILAASASACAAAAVRGQFSDEPLNYPQYLLVWWFSDGVGLAIVTPLILGLWPTGVPRVVERLRLHWYDAVVAAAAMVAISLILLADNARVGGWPIRPVLLLPFAVYAGARLSPRATAVVAAGVAALLLFVTRSGQQPYGELPIEQTVLQVQQFVIITTITSVGLSTLLAQLRANTRHLEQRVEERTEQLLVANAQLQRLTVTDPLTGVANRRALFAALGREIERYRRHPGDLAVVMFDIDGFKAVNDRHGHAVGDRVLQHVAGLASRIVRGTDTLARYGGEEFAIVAPETDCEQARQMADRIRKAISAAELTSEEGSLRVTASFGVAMLEDDEAGPESVMRRADVALYAAKAAGRNRVVCELRPAAGSEPVVDAPSTIVAKNP
jgi:diguanylate cyclase (GGDEF)-like protein